MLKQRLLTAFILIPLVVWGILALPNSVLALILGVFISIGAWEWGRLSFLQSWTSRVFYVGIAIALMWCCWIFIESDLLIHYVLKLALLWWLLAFLWLVQSGFAKSNNLVNTSIKLIAGLLVLVPAWYAIIILHQYTPAGPIWVLFSMALVWVADSGAYFSGKQWGRTKLAPSISPGKTWQGVYGALALVLIYSVVAGWLIGLRDADLYKLALLGLILVPVSIIGDLFVSIMKRHSGIKDSGNIFPGHGGVMDRIDSLCATAPLFLLGVTWLRIPIA